MLKKIFLGLIFVVAAFLGYVALQPADNVITRSATLAAPPSAIFPHLNDLHKWQGWSPWTEMDPHAKATFTGPASGTGAEFGWDGNDEIGAGKMTIIDSRPDQSVKYRLDFARPFAATSFTEISLKPEGAGTNVTWSMSGQAPFLVRALCILMNSNKMVGDMFEKGLANLGRQAQTAAP